MTLAAAIKVCRGFSVTSEELLCFTPFTLSSTLLPLFSVA